LQPFLVVAAAFVAVFFTAFFTVFFAMLALLHRAAIAARAYKKNGGDITPVIGASKLSASSRPSSSPSSQSSSPLFLLGMWLLSWLPPPNDHKLWAERSRLIQAVDYG